MKHCSFRFHELCALAVIAAATLLRLYLISQNYPGLNSDEGTMGLMAFHIAYRGEYPMFFYGQGFMGSLEAYLAAGMFHLFGPSVFALRFGLLIIFALFLVSMYLLTSQLYTKNLALVTVALLSIGSHEMLFHQLEAAGGYPETLFFGSLLLLLAVLIARSSSQLPLVHKKWKRLIAYGM